MMRIGFLLMMSLFGSTLLNPSLILHAESQGTAQSLVEKLNSPDPMQRVNAFEALRKLSGGLNAQGISYVLLDLLDRENQLTIATLRASNGEAGVGDKYGEVYGEYYSAVLNACRDRCDRQNPRTVEVLANSAYGPFSPFAQQLAVEFGRRLLPPLIQKARSDLGILRNEGVLTMATLVSKSNDLTASDKASVHTAVIAAVSDKEMPVRQAAIMTLGEIGDARDIELLAQIGASDKGTMTESHGKTVYPARDDAQRALVKIQQRNK
jgi:HEAT repeat protein